MTKADKPKLGNDFKEMFGSCTNLTDISGLSSWNTGNVTDMRWMFYNCTNLTNASGINDWDILKVINFQSMFKNCPSHPTFTKRAGTWDSNSTFIPTN